MKENDKKGCLLELLVVLLFFAGAALIGWGLWRISIAAALIYGGFVMLYLSGCVCKVINSNGKDRKL